MHARTLPTNDALLSQYFRCLQVTGACYCSCCQLNLSLCVSISHAGLHRSGFASCRAGNHRWHLPGCKTAWHFFSAGFSGQLRMAVDLLRSSCRDRTVFHWHFTSAMELDVCAHCAFVCRNSRAGLAMGRTERLEGEGDGPDGPFFPSSAQTANQEKISGKYFMESNACERCHGDIYRQWYSSVHHFSSFNNQWYRKSIEYMQDVVGVKPSKWCAGCHDPALLYSGLFNTPIKQIVNRPEAQAGLGCMMCHSIAQVKSTMGQGDFFLEYPKLHELAASNNPAVRWLHDFVINLNPEPHRRVFLKPFMRTQTSEFCSSCHKVHLDFPVNNYRWIRGFNEYDNWQASGISGQGARSFYYPPKPSQCADCHMPAVKSSDKGGYQGAVHSHAFPGANTAVPTANDDAAQLKLTEAFLKDSVTVDIFALSLAPPRNRRADAPSTELATMFAIGEEAETAAPHP